MRIKIIRKVNKEDQGKLEYCEHFIQYFYKKISDPILGEDYYNMGMDSYSCHEFMMDDVKRKYDNLKDEVKLYKSISLVLLGINIATIIAVILS